MRSSLVLTSLVVASMLLAGCGGKKDGTSSPSPTTSPPTTGPTTPPTTPPTPPPPPPEPEVVLNKTLEYVTPTPDGGQAEATFTVKSGYAMLEIKLDVYKDDLCATLQKNPGETPLPNATFFPPRGGGAPSKVDFTEIGPLDCSNDAAPVKKYTKNASITASAGTWKVKLYGTGNVDVVAVVTAKAS